MSRGYIEYHFSFFDLSPITLNLVIQTSSPWLCKKWAIIKRKDGFNIILGPLLYFYFNYGYPFRWYVWKTRSREHCRTIPWHYLITGKINKKKDCKCIYCD